MIKNIKRLGIFDSGVGGLTVLHKLLELPISDYIYVGDTANLPYGQKEPKQIIKFSQRIASFLITEKIDALVVACHTSSAIALPSLQQTFPQIPIIGTISSMLPHALNSTINRRIGIIATQASIHSHIHKNELLKLNPELSIFEQACPKFVPLIESSKINTSHMQDALNEYLKPLLDSEIDTLILGCTHYSLLEEQIKNIVGNSVTLVSSENMIAELLKTQLTGHLPCQKSLKLYVTGNDVLEFEHKAKLILKQSITAHQRILD